jgi:four helix bundle protein
MRDHTSLLAWQEAKEVSRAIIRLCAMSWRPHLRAVFDQLQRASLSVQLNIAEGYALRNFGSVRRHFVIAYGSFIETGELREHLREAAVCPNEEIDALRRRCARSQRLLLGLIHGLRKAE